MDAISHRSPHHIVGRCVERQIRDWLVYQPPSYIGRVGSYVAGWKRAMGDIPPRARRRAGDCAGRSSSQASGMIQAPAGRRQCRIVGVSTVSNGSSLPVPGRGNERPVCSKAALPRAPDSRPSSPKNAVPNNCRFWGDINKCTAGANALGTGGILRMIARYGAPVHCPENQGRA